MTGASERPDLLLPSTREHDGLELHVPNEVDFTSTGSRGGRFLWDIAGARSVRGSADCLEEFIRLDEGSPSFTDAIADFIERFGPLGACVHDLPFRHDEHCWPAGSKPEPSDPRWEAGIVVPDRAIQGRWESIDAWRLAIIDVRTLLEILVYLREGSTAPDELWAVIRAEGDHPAGQWSQQMAFEDELQRWIQYGGVRPRVTWRSLGQVPVAHLEYRDLPGLLAIQLAAAATSHRGLFRCRGCEHPFSPPDGKRRPQRGRHAWCGRSPDCDRSAQKREWARRNVLAKKGD